LVGSNGINGMLDRLVNATTFEYMFKGCSNMNMALPNGLLNYNTKLQKIDGMFYGCSKINALPERLIIRDVTNPVTLDSLTLARNVFGGCSGIRGTIDRNFFAGASSLSDIGYGVNTPECHSGGGNIGANLGFFGNTNIDGYHEDILSHCPNLTNVARLFYHSGANNSLKYCYYTSGNDVAPYVNSISPNLFKNFLNLK
jgi:hypothetical protein